MRVLICIPARHKSSRYPGKPLALLRGASGKARSLVQRTWEAAMQVSGVDRVVVATEDSLIGDAVSGFGAEALMTSPDRRNGTERCAEAMDALGGGYDIVVNLQGDAPLTPPWFIEDLIERLAAHPSAEVATPVLRCDGHALNGFLEDRRAGRVGGTTAVFSEDGRALYFSKEVIPYVTGRYADDQMTPVFHHVGVYAFRPSALESYPQWPIGPLERLEGLEQLRFLEQGRQVLCVEVDARGRRFWEVNNPEDVPRIEAMLAELGIE